MTMDSVNYGNKSQVFIPDDPFTMYVRLKFGQSSFVRVDDDFAMSEGETSDKEGVGIASIMGRGYWT